MDESDTRKTLWDLIESIATCMMVTRDGGRLRARPMKGNAVREENAIWFIAERGSPKEQELAEEGDACLTYADGAENTYVSLSGRVATVRDAALKERFWDDHLSAYFPDGPRDPNAILLRFTPEFGEYWDAPSSRLVVAYRFIEAVITGAKPDIGRNEKLSLA